MTVDESAVAAFCVLQVELQSTNAHTHTAVSPVLIHSMSLISHMQLSNKITH